MAPKLRTKCAFSWGSLVSGVSVPFLFLLGENSRADDTFLPPAPSTVQVAPVEIQKVTLQECIAMAMDRQPALAAARASLDAAETNLRGLESIHVPEFIVRELPIRRKQSTLGISIASAALSQAEHETKYAVTRTYFYVLFARAQQQVAGDAVAHLKATLDTAKRLVEGGSREVTTSSVDKINVYLRLAETRQVDAGSGVQRATAALREAIGLEPFARIEVVDDKLPEPSPLINREEIVALALAHRGELTQAIAAEQVTCLEVEAQGTTCKLQKNTFAYVVDIHAKQIPQGISNGEYRPGGLALEMPPALVGPKSARMERARFFNIRTAAVVDKTRNLIALEAEDAFLKWEEASKKVPQTHEAAKKGSQLSENTRQDFGGEQRVKSEDVVANEILAAQAQAQFNEARYQQAIALAALERVTAGGYRADFSTAPIKQP